jgi:hypothetical protein
MPGQNAARIHLKERRPMRRAQRVHRADQCQVVGVLRHMREQLGNVHAALTMLLKLPRRRHQSARRAHRRAHFAHTGHRFALPLQ